MENVFKLVQMDIIKILINHKALILSLQMINKGYLVFCVKFQIVSFANHFQNAHNVQTPHFYLMGHASIHALLYFIILIKQVEIAKAANKIAKNVQMQQPAIFVPVQQYYLKEIVSLIVQILIICIIPKLLFKILLSIMHNVFLAVQVVKIALIIKHATFVPIIIIYIKLLLLAQFV